MALCSLPGARAVEEALQIVSKLRQLRLMVGYGLSASGRDEAQSLISHLRSCDTKIVKLTTMIHSIEDEFKGAKIAKLDKRLLTDSEWCTTIGRQAGTVFNTPAPGVRRATGSTPEENGVHHSSGNALQQIQDQRPVASQQILGDTNIRRTYDSQWEEAAGVSDAGFPRSIMRSMRADLEPITWVARHRRLPFLQPSSSNSWVSRRRGRAG